MLAAIWCFLDILFLMIFTIPANLFNQQKQLNQTNTIRQCYLKLPMTNSVTNYMRNFPLGSTLSGNDLPGESSGLKFKPRVMKLSLNKEEAELM